MRSLLVALGILLSSLSFARTGFLVDPQGRWATIVLESKISPWGGEALCGGPEALRFFDALKIRPELGADAVVRSYRSDSLAIKCEYVRSFDFVSCSLKLEASENILIDAANERVSATWEASLAEPLLALWDASCAGPSFLSEDSRLQMHWLDDASVTLSFEGQGRD
jgi:hypothetical protein